MRVLFEIFEVGARYHMYHALALLGVPWAPVAGSTCRDRRLALCRRYRSLFRQPLRAQPQRRALAERRHAARRSLRYGRLAVFGLSRMAQLSLITRKIV